MRQEGMPPHIQKHSLVVTRIALYLTRLLNEDSSRLDARLVESAGLLHDIAKMQCILTGENHALVGAYMVEQWGYHAIAPIVADHIHLKPEQLDGPLTESLLVNYADKRVKHEEIVTLEERFRDLIERYSTSSEMRRGLEGKLSLYLRLQEKIFERIIVDPDDLLYLNL